LQILKGNGFTVIPPSSGMLACGDTGEGKMPDESVLMDYILAEAAYEKDMKGLKVLVTAGPTREAIDPVRFITNHSSGKMGYAIAKIAMLRGADVTLVTGKTSIAPPPFVDVVDVTSAEDMYNAVIERSDVQDIIIKSAAVADYRPVNVSDEKIKKSDTDMSIQLERTKDILKKLGETKKENQFICGFSMETQNMLENSRTKLKKKNIDMIVANNLKDAGAGFNADTNKVTVITRDNETEYDLMSKDEVAERLLNDILKERQK
jgi:phosphopantothenoylcysteine decarboxylase/phosphopantothenate--cysteine ligase